MKLSDDDLAWIAGRDRRAVDPPISGGDGRMVSGRPARWWVKVRQQWLGRVRRADGKQRWIKAVDLRPINDSQF